MRNHLRLAACYLLLACLVACGDSAGLSNPSCSTFTTKVACEADARCQPFGCPDCQGGDGFSGCYPKGSQPEIACAAIACAPTCEQNTTEAACRAQGGCHAVYRDDGNCACASPGCCTRFSACSSEPIRCKADPNGPLCDALPPSCEGDYQVGYTDSCYEGCLKKSDCD